VWVAEEMEVVFVIAFERLITFVENPSLNSSPMGGASIRSFRDTFLH
jgi:hypothetical protein